MLTSRRVSRFSRRFGPRRTPSSSEKGRATEFAEEAVQQLKRLKDLHRELL